MFEKDLPGGNTTGFGGQAVATHLPLETCETINDAWGFNITDQNYKSVKQLIQYLVRDAGYGANFLLNIGPMPNGEIQKEFTERLSAMGEWLKTNGSTISGTKGGFVKPQSWGAVTEKGNTIYFHFLNNPGEKLLIRMPAKVKSAKLFVGKTPVSYESLKDNYIVLDLRGIKFDDIDTIVEFEVTR